MEQFGAIEIGGTKTLVAVGSGWDDLSPAHRIATTEPDETIGAVVTYLAEHDLAAVGVCCFGPLDLDPMSTRFGTMQFTPKRGWSNTPVRDLLQTALSIPVFIDTDVNGAALGEGRWGATQRMANFAYVTVGTGVGTGIVVDGKTITHPRHPEMGHVAVRRLSDDPHPGSCPYHGDCLEGLAAGPALEARYGVPESWAGHDQVLRLANGYLAQGLLDLVYIAGPERIVVGGGVTRLPGFHDDLRHRLGTMMAGYPQMPDLELLVSPPGLGTLSGLAGGLVLAATGLR